MKFDRPSELLAGQVSGPAAATQATVLALAKAVGARAVVLVEGISDQIAVETLACCWGPRLGAEGVTVVPVGGAHAVGRYLRRFGPEGAVVSLAGLCDAGAEDIVRRGLAAAGVGSPRSRADLERMGFHLCVEDLEEELIRAAGVALVEELFAAQGDLGSFRILQRQPAWRGRPQEAQLRRFLGAGSQRKLRYARLLLTRSTSTACRSHSTPYSPPFSSRPRIPDNLTQRHATSPDPADLPGEQERAAARLLGRHPPLPDLTEQITHAYHSDISFPARRGHRTSGRRWLGGHVSSDD